MRDYYAEFIENGFQTEHSGNQLTKLTKVPFEVSSTPSVSFVSAHSRKHEINTAVSFEDPRECDRQIVIEKVVDYLSNKDEPVAEWKAIEAYTSKLERVRSDAKLTADFDDLCEERKSVLIIEGGMTEGEAEAFVSSIQFLTECLMTV